MKKHKTAWWSWIIYVLWALLLTAINQWLVAPLVEDFAVLGVLAVLAMGALWLTSVPKSFRKRWITFTVFALLLADGFQNIAFYSLSSRLEKGIIMVVGIGFVAWLFARVRVFPMLLTAVVLFVANSMLPISEWPFLTHFKVSYYGRLRLQPQDMSALPLVPVKMPGGRTVLVTLSNVVESRTELFSAAKNATGTPNALNDLLTNYGHRYEFVEIVEQSGKFVQKPIEPQVLARVNPDQLVSSFLPFTMAQWSVENGNVIQTLSATVSTLSAVQLTTHSSELPQNVLGLSLYAQDQELKSWDQMLTMLGVSPQAPDNLVVKNGYLTGTYHGKTIHAAVDGTQVIGYGSFTSPNAHQVLVEGSNLLQVVSLDSAQGKVVTEYQGNPQNPIPNDLVIGPVDNSGEDVVFVNASPAFILKPELGAWKTLYTAPNPSFRFEAALRLATDKTPEIITDDPSYIRNTLTRYFSSYTYRNGQLVRNWRVFHTNVVNVTPVQFQANGPTYIVADLYSTGKFLILRRHTWPVIPATVVLGVVALVIGWIVRLRQRGKSR